MRGWGLPWGRFLQLAFLQALGVLRHDQVVDHVLYVAVHEGREVVDRIVDAVVGDTSLRIVVVKDILGLGVDIIASRDM